MKQKKYIINQEVFCRIEDPEGAILFHPETDALQAINTTGLTIWQALESPRAKYEIVNHLLNNFQDASVDQVYQDVAIFLQRLKLGGFIAEVFE